MSNEIFIDGDVDTTQLRVQGNAVQTEPLQTWEQDSGSVLTQITSDGRIVIGTKNQGTDNAQLEASQDSVLPSSLPQRGIQTLGCVTVNIPETSPDEIAWSVHELELAGTAVLSGIHRALRSKVTCTNTGGAASSELRAGDFEVINEGGAVDPNRVKEMIGVQATVTNETTGHLDKAVGLKVTLNDEGTDPIQTIYGLQIEDLPAGSGEAHAIHTGQGVVHLGDYVEIVKPGSVPGQPDQDNVRIYPKSDGKLYAKNWEDQEYDLTGTGGISGKYAKAAYVLSQGTSGGATTSGAVNIPINTLEDVDNIGIQMISPSYLVLPPGKYFIQANTPVFRVNRARLDLMRSNYPQVGESTMLIQGENVYASASYSGQVRARVCGVVQFDETEQLWLRRYTQSAKADNGGGVEIGFLGDEIYTVIEIWKLDE